LRGSYVNLRGKPGRARGARLLGNPLDLELMKKLKSSRECGEVFLSM